MNKRGSQDHKDPMKNNDIDKIEVYPKFSSNSLRLESTRELLHSAFFFGEIHSNPRQNFSLLIRFDVYFHVWQNVVICTNLQNLNRKKSRN